MSDVRSIQRFRIIDELGAGAMGTVVRAFDPQLEREVAIKILVGAATSVRSELSTFQTLDLRAGPSRDDLLSEARMMARLSHPNVVAVHEVGLDGDAVFVVMEYVAGTDLRHWLAGTRTRDEIVEIFAQAARGLAAAHAQGIVHRDFKPENVLVGRDGRTRVADFGLSRLVVPNAMVQVVETGGTPQYMAPELWRGAPATAASDVFAFCVSLAESLGASAETLAARGLGKDLVARISAGLSEDPAARPSIEAILDALARPRARPARGRRAALVLGAAVAGITVAVVASRSGAPTCPRDPEILDGQWGPTQREALRRVLAPHPTPVVTALVDRLLARIDERAEEIVAAAQASCQSRARGELTADQATRRRSCLERRAIELGAIVRSQLASERWDLPVSEERLQGGPRAASCDELEAAPIADRARVIALYDRFAALHREPEARAREIAGEVERDATSQQELELAARAGISFAMGQRFADQLAASDATLQRAHRNALAIRDNNTAALALVERSTTAAMTGDPKLGESFAHLALELADRPTTAARTRARIYASLGRAALQRGDYAIAEERLRRGLALMTGVPDVMTTIGMQTDLVHTLRGLDKLGEAKTLATESLELIRTQIGEHSNNYAVGLDALADVHKAARELERAIEIRRRALATLLEVLPPDRATVIRTRAQLASDLSARGDFELARQEYARAVAQTETNEALKPFRGALRADLAIATFDVGKTDEAVRLLERAIEELTSQHGADHPMTLGYRISLLDYHLELGQLDLAARDVAALEEGYRSRPAPDDVRPALLRGAWGAQLAIARGDANNAERASRQALAELAERGAGDLDRRLVLYTLADAQLASRHHAEARATLAELAKVTARAHMTEDIVALEELLLARAELGLGQTTSGLAHAEHARAVFARMQNQPKALRQATELLAAHRR